MWLEIHHDGLLCPEDIKRDRNGREVDIDNFPDGTMIVCPFCRKSNQPESIWESTYSTIGYPMLWCSNCDARAVVMMHEREPAPFGTKIALGKIDRVVNHQLQYRCPEPVPEEKVVRFLSSLTEEEEEEEEDVSDEEEEDVSDEDDEDLILNLKKARRYLHPECRPIRTSELDPYLQESNLDPIPDWVFNAAVTVNSYDVFDQKMLDRYSNFDNAHDGIYILVLGHDRNGKQFTMQFNGD